MYIKSDKKEFPYNFQCGTPLRISDGMSLMIGRVGTGPSRWFSYHWSGLVSRSRLSSFISRRACWRSKSCIPVEGMLSLEMRPSTCKSPTQSPFTNRQWLIFQMPPCLKNSPWQGPIDDYKVAGWSELERACCFGWPSTINEMGTGQWQHSALDLTRTGQPIGKLDFGSVGKMRIEPRRFSIECCVGDCETGSKGPSVSRLDGAWRRPHQQPV